MPSSKYSLSLSLPLPLLICLHLPLALNVNKEISFRTPRLMSSAQALASTVNTDVTSRRHRTASIC